MLNGVMTSLYGDEVPFHVLGDATVSDMAHGRGGPFEVIFDQPVAGVCVDLGDSPGDWALKLDGEAPDLRHWVQMGRAELSGAHGAVDGSICRTRGDGALPGRVTLFHPVISVAVRGRAADIRLDATSFRAPGIGTDTLLRGQDKRLRAADIVAGDMLWTGEGGFRPVLWAGTSALADTSCRAARPIHIAAGALGIGLPHRDMTVSRMQPLRISRDLAARLHGADRTVLPAYRLTSLPGVTVSKTPTDYVHIILDEAHMVEAEGAPCASMTPTPGALASLPEAARQDLIACQPGIRPAAQDGWQAPLERWLGAHAC